MSSTVMDLVSYYEQRQAVSSRNGPLAQPQAVCAGSTGKLLAIDAQLDSPSFSHLFPQEPAQIQEKVPQKPHEQSRYGFPIAPQSIHRAGAPKSLVLPQNHLYSSISESSPYAPIANLTGPALPDFTIGSSPSDRAQFPALDSPAAKATYKQGSQAWSGHGRNGSVISIASSAQSSSSLYFPMDISGAGNAMSQPRMGTPPVSPRKRKSPAKSPSKTKDRPNFLDKAIIRNTGVTQEQINSLIGEPAPSDPKNWRCMWNDCSHLAARKENIRAHVQTHLGDRPYECPECHADFVRPHDFTRHYTTHVDSRDFKCPDCPQAFNRADALQRHRDRDFCNGVTPPSSPSKTRRVVEAIDKKKDVPGRRQKKQVLRKKLADAKRQCSADLTDDFWSSSASSPEYLSSDGGSPEMILDVFGDLSATEPSQSYLPTDQTSPEPDFSDNAIRKADEFIQQFMPSIDNVLSPVNSSRTVSLSPPASPEQTHAQTLKPFVPTPQKQAQMTPPASRDSMLNFLNTPSVHHDARTVLSAPSLPDLSSASPSPLAFEQVADFGDMCHSFPTTSNSSNPSETVHDWFGWSISDVQSPVKVERQQQLDVEDFFNNYQAGANAVFSSEAVNTDDLFAGL